MRLKCDKKICKITFLWLADSVSGDLSHGKLSSDVIDALVNGGLDEIRGVLDDMQYLNQAFEDLKNSTDRVAAAANVVKDITESVFKEESRWQMLLAKVGVTEAWSVAQDIVLGKLTDTITILGIIDVEAEFGGSGSVSFTLSR